MTEKQQCPYCQGVRAEGFTCPRCDDTGFISTVPPTPGERPTEGEKATTLQPKAVVTTNEFRYELWDMGDGEREWFRCNRVHGSRTMDHRTRVMNYGGVELHAALEMLMAAGALLRYPGERPTEPEAAMRQFLASQKSLDSEAGRVLDEKRWDLYGAGSGEARRQSPTTGESDPATVPPTEGEKAETEGQQCSAAGCKGNPARQDQWGDWWCAEHPDDMPDDGGEPSIEAQYLAMELGRLRDRVAILERLAGKVHHLNESVDAPLDALEANCVRLPNGECVSEKDCMHGPPAPDSAPQSARALLDEAGVKQLLAEAQVLCDAATEGPWYYVHGYGFNFMAKLRGDGPPNGDTRFIARARTLIPELIAALQPAIGRPAEGTVVEAVVQWASVPGSSHFVQTTVPADWPIGTRVIVRPIPEPEAGR